ncbi:MAG: histidine kinase [Gemmiger sp.]|nr:histidine kinase [Gemmiger sp.]
MSKKWLSSFSIRSIILISFIPLILLILITYYGFFVVGSRQLESQAYQSATNINAQISNSLGQTLNAVYHAAEGVTSNWYFFNMRQNLLKNKAEAISPANYYRLHQLLQNQITANTNYFRSISLFLDNNSIFVFLSTQSSEHISSFDFDYAQYQRSVSAQNLTWVFPQQGSPPQTSTQGRSALGLMMLLGDENSAVRGFILFELNDQLIQKEIQNAIIAPGSQFAITSGNQVLLQTGAPIAAAALAKIPAEPSAGSLAPAQFSFGQNCFFYTPVAFGAPDISLGVLSEIPSAAISLNQKPLSKAMVVVVLLFLACCAGTYFLIYFTVSQPLIELNNCLVQPHDLTKRVRFEVSGSREIQTINQTLNNFLAHIRHLIRDLNHEMDERRITELNILYEQINPHFLYNALDTIYQLCDLREVDSAMEMTHSLATFYRIGVSKGASFLTLEEECTHAAMYLSVMKIRFADFTYEIDLPENLKKCVTIKKLLQPILENAIYHGIHPLQDKMGHILIQVREGDAGLVVTIADNGVGIPPPALKQIEENLCLKFDPVEKGKLYGLKNVHARIQLTYRADYGLRIESAPEQGTTVTILLPKEYERPGGICEQDENFI